MSKVLVVDDEERYRDHLSRALLRDDHEVRTAASGRDAISVGSRFRPEVLVADWMLKSQVHGLHVSEALRAVVPELRTILITGYPSFDLRNEAQKHHVSKFIEKPFELDELREAVRRAGSATPAPRRQTTIAVLEVDRDGAILFANSRARELLASAVAGGDGENLREVFDPVAFKQIPAATRRWVTVSPRSAAQPAWHLRAREYAGLEARLLIVVPDGQRHGRQHPAVRMLLDLESSGAVRWPFEGRALIVDADDMVRRIVAAQIEQAGGICHTADTLGNALQTFRRDADIDVVILDYDLAVENLRDFVRQIRAIRPDVRIVGTSGSEGSTDFEDMSVEQFLLKPWTIRDLINLLTGRIGSCVECGLPLPLRKPIPGETPGHWVCAGCGGRYSAVFDNNSPADVIRNARPAEGPQS
ncbi:MAG: response regulator [Phycisphaerae bacterium]